ncbi:CPXCG motif-containing cysteine-rich protein [Idiomarina tyrosinivorans]|uniref:CPXCG motif-containing cysteine-rich protein n=1 Tax=Idiomarina tyrosinivorans TaxID=1445662 RepID=A0A432ZTZ6_9GAMM|nr:CPXCG motif-containing cysteine-rich protein [Idiomarina tyrosinivorans]RUO81414.1 CPXCG motif-containing cysteine-rich protein [Idiomarina tyrosinivorans]
MQNDNIKNTTVKCPHCGHHTHLVLDPTEGDQDYQDECAACGELIHVHMEVDQLREKIRVKLDGNDEQFY